MVGQRRFHERQGASPRFAGREPAARHEVCVRVDHQVSQEHRPPARIDPQDDWTEGDSPIPRMSADPVMVKRIRQQTRFLLRPVRQENLVALSPLDRITRASGGSDWHHRPRAGAVRPPATSPSAPPRTGRVAPKRSGPPGPRRASVACSTQRSWPTPPDHLTCDVTGSTALLRPLPPCEAAEEVARRPCK
jgi:hypothetical protein